MKDTGLGSMATVTRIEGWEVTCPKCGEGVGSPGTGAFMWIAQDLLNHDGKVHCYQCGFDSRLPARYIKKAKTP